MSPLRLCDVLIDCTVLATVHENSSQTSLVALLVHVKIRYQVRVLLKFHSVEASSIAMLQLTWKVLRKTVPRRHIRVGVPTLTMSKVISRRITSFEAFVGKRNGGAHCELRAEVE